jgi:hypothetical protein
MQEYCREMEKSKLVRVEMGRGDASAVGKAEVTAIPLPQASGRVFKEQRYASTQACAKARANNSQLERLELEQPQ